MDYKNTLNLPRTDFAMKADLVTREPERLKKWEAAGLYAQIQAARAGGEKFVLHDGPPFANGDVHIGTALNKYLKDIIVKYQTLRGKSAPYIPGWDCHGLPIEFKVSQDMRKAGDTSADPATIRKACDAYARKYIDIQRVQFKRLGVLGDWDNPYLTLNKEYEADELRLFADIVEKGFVYRAKKPVYWCPVCRTALAEAEVEYADHVSQSIYVKFPVVGRPNTFVLIWTTTPWTLPANLAVAYNKDFQYVHVTVGGEHYILFRGLLPAVAEKCGWKDFQEQPFPTEQLAQLEYEHPFIPARKGRAYPANFVTSDTGTGFVHIAPGHGMEDYGLGMSVGLKIYSPVTHDGHFALTDDLPVEQQMPAEMVGKSVLEKHGKSDANEAVLHELRLRHALLHQENYHHSYPHCWRSKNPVIFRATDQWFIKIGGGQGQLTRDSNKEVVTVSLDAMRNLSGLRRDAMIAVSTINWVPPWGQMRIQAAITARPDWCISRQRTWGVPIPAFYDTGGEPILVAGVVRNTADLFEKNGSQIWFEKTAAELWALVKPHDWQGPEAATKSNDTLDVWIDSGSSSRAVLKRREELSHASPNISTQNSKDVLIPELVGQIEQANKNLLPWQADVYLEGSDQHRGWFQSSLLLSLAGNGATPFKTVLTHGFMVDADREKISKSKQAQGGYEKPQTADAYVKKWGADVVRLWVSSQDFRNDIVVSEERIQKVTETYSKLRNALRYQLSNLYDFIPVEHTVADDKLTGLDRWILAEFSKLQSNVQQAYEHFEFHVVYQYLRQFAAVELSAIYHDVIKDRLYTDPANSHRRRSTQTALYRMVKGLCHMMAPILVFTADEAWEYVPDRDSSFIHISEWQSRPFVRSEDETTLWKTLFEFREGLLSKLEAKRNDKLIGKSLDAKVRLFAKSNFFAKLTADKNALEAFRELLNISQLEITEDENAELVVHADGQKCERCWHWETDVGSTPEHPTICARCVEAVKQSQS